MEDERYPYWGACDVEGCEAEICNGGGCWRETGYWGVCLKHAQMWSDGKPQPMMKTDAASREATRDPVTGVLPIRAEVDMPEDDLTTAYMAGYHKRDDEVRLLQAEVERLHAENKRLRESLLTAEYGDVE